MLLSMMSENTTGGYFIYIIIPILSGLAADYKLRLIARILLGPGSTI